MIQQVMASILKAKTILIERAFDNDLAVDRLFDSRLLLYDTWDYTSGIRLFYTKFHVS